MVEKLTDHTIRSILLTLSETSWHAKSATESDYRRHVRHHQHRVVDFSDYSKRARHILNTGIFLQSKPGQQWMVINEVATKLEGDCINPISDEVLPESSFGTKLNTLETLRKIAKMIILSSDEPFAYGLCNVIRVDNSRGEAMLRVAESMSDDGQFRAKNFISIEDVLDLFCQPKDESDEDEEGSDEGTGDDEEGEEGEKGEESE
ncbi:hypothetical protein F5Y16DRAFT_398390 [Xylariaceae sp. FL0255]|nr:hypothetical protein F5Y16DRAFT_398390 [Xylariaceae sp. FL0255]